MKKNLFFLSFMLFVCWITACNKPKLADEPPGNGNLQLITTLGPYDTNLVTQGLAQEVASTLSTAYFEQGDTLPASPARGITNVVTIRDMNNIPAMYICNYSGNNGYAIISADFRYNPVLSYAKKGNLNAGDTIPSMMAAWFDYSVESIEEIRYGQGVDPYPGYSSWLGIMTDFNTNWQPYQLYLPDNMDINNPNQGGCADYRAPRNKALKMPLLQTSWGQGDTYNALVPLSCPSEPGGKAPTGCVATAMAQVIRYWETTPAGTTYNYSSMPNTTGNYEVQRLMADCGDEANMDYDCEESGATMGAALMALASDFGFEKGAWNPTYSKYNSTALSASYVDISDYNETKNELNLNRPVLLSGCRGTTKVLIFITIGEGCHAWITDGYKEWGNLCYTDRYLHMNWGWGYSGFNTWYYFNDWSPGTYTYYYDLDFVKNLHP